MSEEKQTPYPDKLVTDVPTLSTGMPATLKSYRALAELLFPKALPMLDRRIEEFGEDEIVIQHESQMIYLFNAIQTGEAASADPAVWFGETECRRHWGLPDEEVTR